MEQIEINSSEKIDKAREALNGLSIKENAKTNTALIKSLKKEILVARKKGKTWAEISEALSEASINASPALLSIVFNTEKSKKNGEKTDKKISKKNEKKSENERKNNETAAPGGWGAVVPESGHHTVKPDRKVL